MLKKTLLTTAVLVSLVGCNDSDEYIYEPIISQDISLMTRYADTQSFSTRTAKSTALPSYEHQLVVDGYEIEVDELDDGGHDYYQNALTLTEGNYTLPVVGRAQITLTHPSSLLAPAVRSGNVSQVYTYRASEYVDNGQSQANLVFKNDDWVYTSLVLDPGFSKTIQSVSLIDASSGDTVAMTEVIDNGTTYYYGYVRADAKIEVVTAEDGSSETSILVSQQPPADNTITHVEFQVDGDTELSDPVWENLPPLTPPPPVEDILFTDTKSYPQMDKCRAAAMKADVEHYIFIAGGCLLEDPQGELSGNELVENAGATISKTPVPISFKEVVSANDRLQCNQAAFDDGASFYAVGDLTALSVSSADCMVSTTVENDIDYYEYDLILDHDFTFYETQDPNNLVFYTETQQDTRDLCVEQAYDVRSYATDFAYNAATKQCYHRDPNGATSADELVGLTIKSTPYSLMWLALDNGKDAATSREACKKRTSEANQLDTSYFSSSEANCYRGLDEPVADDAKERTDFTLKEDGYVRADVTYFYVMFDSSNAYRDISGDDICTSLGESPSYAWNSTTKLPSCGGTDIAQNTWLEHCSTKGGTAYFETDFNGSGQFSCIQAEATKSSSTTFHWDLNGLEFCQNTKTINNNYTLLYQHTTNDNGRCLDGKTADLSDPTSDAVNMVSEHSGFCSAISGGDMPMPMANLGEVGLFMCSSDSMFPFTTVVVQQ